MAYNLKTIKQDFKNKGIYYTPPELALKLKSYLNFEPTKVYDPTCGDGALLTVFDDNVEKFGQEINQEQLTVANTKLVNFTGFCGDTLTTPAFLDQKFDCILANPPFSIEWTPQIDVRFESAPCVPSPSRADYAFILHCLHYLSDEGVAIILSFPGVLYRGSREGQIRKWLIESNYIDKVISIAPDTFVDTKIGTAILILRKNKINTDIEFIDDSNTLSKIVDIEEINSNDFNLTVSNYVTPKEIEKETINPRELEFLARKQMIQRLKKDLDFSKVIAELENWSFTEYLDDLKNFLNDYEKQFNFFKI